MNYNPALYEKTELNIQSNNVTMPMIKYQVMLGMILGITKSLSGESLRNVVSEKLHMIAEENEHPDKNLTDTIQELQLLIEYSNLQVLLDGEEENQKPLSKKHRSL